MPIPEPDLNPERRESSEPPLESDHDVAMYEERRFLSWHNLSRLAGSTGLRRYTGLVFVLPIVAAGINAIHWSPLHLPATLTLAYVAGLFFLCGILLVQAWCPDICRDGRTAAVMEAEGRTKQYLIHQSRETYLALRAVSINRANHFLHDLFAYYVEDTCPGIVEFLSALTNQQLTKKDVWQLNQTLVKHPPDFREAFWHVQWFAATSRKHERRIAAAFLGGGLLFASLAVAFQAAAVLTAWRAS